jgi:hypothetical protein
MMVIVLRSVRTNGIPTFLACYGHRAGIAFTEQGFGSMMEFLYTGVVLDVDKLQAACTTSS